MSGSRCPKAPKRCTRYHHAPACTVKKPCCRWRRAPPCHCDAYPWPHRKCAGACGTDVPADVQKSRSWQKAHPEGVEKRCKPDPTPRDRWAEKANARIASTGRRSRGKQYGSDWGPLQR